ncbi:MAG: hypothetical protein ACYSWS_05095 [Planctomycetota bacterium]
MTVEKISKSKIKISIEAPKDVIVCREAVQKEDQVVCVLPLQL